MYAAILLSLLLPLAAQAQLLGGVSDTTLDASDPNVLFAVSAINEFHAGLGDAEPRTLVKVVKAQTQVVAGTLYHLQLQLTSASGQEEICKVEVWSRPWLSGDDALQLSRDPACKPIDKATVSPMRAGGSVLADVNDEDTQKALMFATDTLNAKENSLYYRRPVKVEEVKSQVVSGIAYHFRGVHMAATTCSKTTATSDLSLCAVKDPADVRVCDLDVWWQAWMTPEYKMTNMKCQ